MRDSETHIDDVILPQKPATDVYWLIGGVPDVLGQLLQGETERDRERDFYDERWDESDFSESASRRFEPTTPT